MPAPDLSEPVPLARLVTNVSQYIKQHPKDAEGYYTLGRVHSIAFAKSFIQEPPHITIIRGGANGQSQNHPLGKPYKAIKAVEAGKDGNYGNKNLPYFYDSGRATRNKPNQPVSSDDLFHLHESVRYYTKATELAPQEGIYWLGLGWALEQGIPYAAQMGAPWAKPALKKSSAPASEWTNRALAAYRRAYNLGSAKMEYLGIESGESISRIQSQSPRPLALQETEEMAQVRLTVAKIRKSLDEAYRRQVVVSPIILPLGHSTSLSSLLSLKKSVTFDLTGSNLGKRWPWVSSDTGILVWDPQRLGKITSGRQLFGSVTWWIFWKNGYQALAALDNNGDGILTGSELDGIAIWRDANGNGVSDAGEVKPLSEWNIVAVAARATHQVSGMPSNLRGITRADGTIVPSYDWTPRSLN